MYVAHTDLLRKQTTKKNIFLPSRKITITKRKEKLKKKQGKEKKIESCYLEEEQRIQKWQEKRNERIKNQCN